MIHYKYIVEATAQIARLIETYGEDGRSELNRLADSHTVTLLSTADPSIEYTDCDIHNGTLRLLFAKDQLGVNISRAAENIADAINNASLVSPEPLSNTGRLSFLALQSIKLDYEPHLLGLRSAITDCVGSSDTTLNPNFDVNFRKLAAYKGTDYDFPRDWQKTLGLITRRYFEGLTHYLQDAGFAGDDLLKDGLREALFRGEVAVRVVDNLCTEGRDFFECLIEDGVLYLQTLARYWGTGCDDVARGLLDIL